MIESNLLSMAGAVASIICLAAMASGPIVRAIRQWRLEHERKKLERIAEDRRLQLRQ